MKRRGSALARWASGLGRVRARVIEWCAERFPRIARGLDRCSTFPVFLAVLALVAIAALSIAIHLGRGAGRPAPATAPAASGAMAPGAGGSTREVLLFFQRADRLWLGTETGEIFSALSDTEQAKQVLELLVRGPAGKEGLLPTIPPEARLRGVYLGPDGTAYADFSRDLAEKHPGGTHAEIATIYSIVDSLAYNIPRIRRVQILLDGHEVQTLAGHIGLHFPLPPDYAFVDRTPPQPEAKGTRKGGRS